MITYPPVDLFSKNAQICIDTIFVRVNVIDVIRFCFWISFLYWLRPNTDNLMYLLILHPGTTRTGDTCSISIPKIKDRFSNFICQNHPYWLWSYGQDSDNYNDDEDEEETMSENSCENDENAFKKLSVN